MTRPKLVASLSVPLALAVFCAFATTARAQELYVASEAGGLSDSSIGVYSLSGEPINPTLITGLNGPQDILISGNTLYVSNLYSGTVGEYNATTGAAINASLISGLHHGATNGPSGLALFNGNLLVSTDDGDTIGEYNASTGATINAAFIRTGAPVGLAISNGDLFVTSPEARSISEYEATTGAAINPTLVSTPAGAIAVSGDDLFVTGINAIGEYTTSGTTINQTLINSGLTAPSSIAILGNDLYVTNSYETNGTVGIYSASGAVITTSLITGLNFPSSIAIVLPEPSSVVLCGLGAIGLGAIALRRSRRNAAPAGQSKA